MQWLAGALLAAVHLVNAQDGTNATVPVRNLPSILRSGHTDASWHNSSPMLPTPTQPRPILPLAPLPAQHSLHPSTRPHGAQAPAIGPRLTREHVLS